MDKIPNLPTDNFYIFCIFIGISLMLGPLWVLRNRLHEMTKAEVDQCWDEVIKKPMRIGWAICVFGFMMWYFKHQVFQDRLISLEVERAEVRLEIERAELQNLTNAE